MADVSTKTIYRYVEEGNVYAVRIAGKTLRVCRGCLLKPFSGE
jgi:predicted site-specific integrase-resolvase